MFADFAERCVVTQTRCDLENRAPRSCPTSRNSTGRRTRDSERSSRRLAKVSTTNVYKSPRGEKLRIPLHVNRTEMEQVRAQLEKSRRDIRAVFDRMTLELPFPSGIRHANPKKRKDCEEPMNYLGMDRYRERETERESVEASKE